MARNDARIASDFWSWKNSMKALMKATAMRIPPRYVFWKLSYVTRVSPERSHTIDNSGNIP